MSGATVSMCSPEMLAASKQPVAIVGDAQFSSNHQIKDFARQIFKAFNFRSKRSSFSFKYYRVNFLFCELAGAVHEGGDLLDGGIVLEDAVDV